MKAAVYSRYGPPDVVHITDVEQPVPRDNEVLIQVRAASVNPLDWHFKKNGKRMGSTVRFVYFVG
jgi:NADPH:quinone reductase and related Zn-dependent oxidoreductases